MSDVRIGFEKPDARPLVWLDDAHDVGFAKFSMEASAVHQEGNCTGVIVGGKD